MIYIKDKESVLCKGDFRPAQFYKGKKKIAGYVTETFEGVKMVTLENCYNDRLHNAKIHGNTESVGDLVSGGEHSGKYKIGVIARGKNLLNSDLWLPYFDKLEDGSYKSKQYITTSQRIAVNLPAGNYTMSVDIKCESSKNYKPCFYYADGNRIQVSALYSNGDWKHGEWSFTLAKDAVAVGWYYSETSKQLYFKNFQIEYGDTATEFDEFKEPQTFDIFLDEPLRSEEYIDFENGRVVRENGEEELSLPDIPTTRGTTVCEINTNISARISGEYKKMEE